MIFVIIIIITQRKSDLLKITSSANNLMIIMVILIMVILIRIITTIRIIFIFKNTFIVTIMIINIMIINLIIIRRRGMSIYVQREVKDGWDGLKDQKGTTVIAPQTSSSYFSLFSYFICHFCQPLLLLFHISFALFDNYKTPSRHSSPMLTQFVTPAKYIWAKLTYFNPSICWSWNDEGWLCGKCARVRLWEFSIVKRLKGPVIYDCAVLWKWKGSSQWATDSRVIYGSYCCDIVFFTAGKKGKVKSKNLIKQLAQQPGNYCSCCAL